MNYQLKTHIEKGTNQTMLNDIQALLQFYVATLMDNDIAG